MPCQIVRGVVDLLALNVPWMNITRENISIEAKNCFVLLRIDVRKVHEFCTQREAAQGKRLIKEMEEKVIETFKLIQNKQSNYLSSLLQGLLKSIKIHVENLRLRVELIDLADPLAGGFELIFNELNYDNSMASITETRFEGEYLASGLNIFDLRLKGLNKDKLVLLKSKIEDIRALPTEEFKKYFKNESNPSYLLCPFLVQANFTRKYTDATKENYKGLRTVEFSPIQLNLSNQDLQLASAVNSLLSTVQEYTYSRKISMLYNLRDQSLTNYLAALHLNNLLYRLWTVKNSNRRKAYVAQVQRLKREYTYCYETKIFHLMENEFEKTTERLFDLQYSIPTFDLADEKTIEETIARCEEIEKILHSSIIMSFRDQAMKKCRNQTYFKSRLLEQKKRVKAFKEKNAGLSGMLRKGINKLWGSSAKDTESDIEKLVEAESGNKVDKDIKEKLLKQETKIETIFELKCPVVKLCLTRHNQQLLQINLGWSKFNESVDLVNMKGSTSFKLQKLTMLDSEGKLFVEIIKDQGIASGESPMKDKEDASQTEAITDASKKIYNCLEFHLNYDLIKDIEKDEYNKTAICAKFSMEHFCFEFSRELLAKIIYFSIDFSERFGNNSTTVSQGWQARNLKRKGDLACTLNNFMKLDEKLKTFEVEVRSLILIVKHSVSPMFVGLKLVPRLDLSKNEIVANLDQFEVFYDDCLFNMKTISVESHQLKDIKKLIRPCWFKFCVLRRTQNRLSLDVKIGNFEFFLNDQFLGICSHLVSHFSSIKLLHTDSFFDNLKKTNSKSSIKPTKKKLFMVPRLGLSLRKNSIHSIKPSRKASGNTFLTGNSDMMEDEFFDAFEDEAELFAHNELKSRLDLLENVGMMLPSQLAIIEENHRAHLLRRSEARFEEKQSEIELAITLGIDEMAMVFFSKNDPENYIQINLSQIRLFCDFKEISIKIHNLTAILKQNLLTLIMKDYLTPIAPILALLQPKDSPINHTIQEVSSEVQEEPLIEGNNHDTFASPRMPSDHHLKKSQLSSQLSSLKSWLHTKGRNVHFELEIQTGAHIYLTEQTSHFISPGIYFFLKPTVTFTNGALKLTSDLKMDVFNEEIGFYEPFIEEFQAEVTLSSDSDNLLIENSVNNWLLNLKPSILKNMFDYLSVYSSQKIKLSAERNSVITIRNETGVGISYMVNMNGVNKLLKPYEIVEVNLMVMPKDSQSGQKALIEVSDHSIQNFSFIDNKANLLKIVGRFGEEKFNGTSLETHRHIPTTSFFSKKKIMLEIPSFGVNCTIDLSNMTGAHIKLTDHIFLVATLEVTNYHSVLTLRSNYRIVNKLDFDVECAAYLLKSSYAKEEIQLSHNLFHKKKQRSEVLSEGDNISVADSIDLTVNEPFQKFNFNATQSLHPKAMQIQPTETSSTKEERPTLFSKFVIKSKGKKYLPLLKNFPKSYFVVIKPANLDFYQKISDEPGVEMTQVKSQIQHKNRVYFEELFRKSCCISKLELKHSVRNINLEIQ